MSPELVTIPSTLEAGAWEELAKLIKCKVDEIEFANALRGPNLRGVVVAYNKNAAKKKKDVNLRPSVILTLVHPLLGEVFYQGGKHVRVRGTAVVLRFPTRAIRKEDGDFLRYERLTPKGEDGYSLLDFSMKDFSSRWGILSHIESPRLPRDQGYGYLFPRTPEGAAAAEANAARMQRQLNIR